MMGILETHSASAGKIPTRVWIGTMFVLITPGAYYIEQGHLIKSVVGFGNMRGSPHVLLEALYRFIGLWTMASSAAERILVLMH